MDDLLATLQQATGTQPAAASAGPVAFDLTKSYGTPPQMLDNLANQESSGGKNLVNPTTGAMGPYQFTPSTIAMLRNQGVKFDPFDPQQSRAAADWYIQNLKSQNGGTYEGALKAYGGFKNTDPSTYIDHVENGVPGFSGAPAPTTPGQSNSGQQPGGYTGPTSDLLSTLQSAVSAPAQAAPAMSTPPGAGMPSAPMHPTTAAQNGSSWSDAAEKGVGNLASSVIGIAGAGARLVGANDFADKAQAARAQIEQQMQADTNNSVAGKVAGVVGGALPYATLGGASIPGAMAGGAIAGAVPSIADNRSGVETAQGAALGAGLGAGGALAGKAIGALVPSMAHMFGGSAGADAEAAAPSAAAATAGARGSVGAAGTSFAQQAAAEGVPDVLVQKIAKAEQNGTLNPTAAGRHIEAGSLPVPVELTAGQASGDIHLLSDEFNARAKNPELANRFNAQNGQINDNLTAIRDQVSPNVNVPSGAPTGQALVDAYKEMDAPIRQQISDLYAQARGNDGAPALVDAAPQMKDFASQVGPTRFNALPANVQQIFRDASSNQVALPPGFEVNGSSFRPMNVGDLMDIDKTLSGAMRSASDGSVRHDIGALRDSIVNSQLDPSAAGADAFSAYKTAQASARARFQAMDADSAYKAAVNDIAPAGEPSALADDFARKYIAGGKTSNVQNMMQNLSNDPANQELVASALMDHIRQQAGVDLRTGTGNISQAGLNKALVNLGDKTRIVLGPQASQTLEKVGNVARYTQEQPRGSYINNSGTFVASAKNAVKTAAEQTANAVAYGIPVGTWTRQAIARRVEAKGVAKSLEPGAGLTAVPLNQLVNDVRGNP